MNKQDKQKLTDTDNLCFLWLPEERGEGEVVKGAIYMLTEGDLTLGGKHTMQSTADVSDLYTWYLCNFINQSHPNTFNLF